MKKLAQSFDLEIFVTPGLGDNSYLLYSGDEAVIVDPQRDAWRFLSQADNLKVKVRHVLETHVHNDYLTGALEIRTATGADIVVSAEGKYEFLHTSVREQDELRIGDLRLVCFETPGHTPEHVSWLVYENGNDEALAIFTGGSLLVGGAGRTDLLGPAWTSFLTQKQYQSTRRIAGLPPTVRILPTHGGGSFCTAANDASDKRTSTLAEELHANQALRPATEEEFIRRQLQGLKEYPKYYSFMARINRVGPPLLGKLPSLASLSAREVSEHIKSGVWAVDCRDRKSFANSHIPGSLNIELRENFGTYVGWIIPFGSPLILILPDDEKESEDEAVSQLIRIGYERLVGSLEKGMASWIDAGFHQASYPIGTMEELCAEYQQGEPQLFDVRQKDEWDAGHAAGSVHAFIGNLPETAGSLPQNGEAWVVCATGFRAAMAASYLQGVGFSVRLLAEGGVEDFLERCPDQRA